MLSNPSIALSLLSELDNGILLGLALLIQDVG